jgi:hypothetical protein
LNGSNAPGYPRGLPKARNGNIDLDQDNTPEFVNNLACMTRAHPVRKADRLHEIIRKSGCIVRCFPAMSRRRVSPKFDRGFGDHKARTAERDFPYIVEIAVPEAGLEVSLNRELMAFHQSYNIRPRFGRRIKTNNKLYYCRWCFSDPAIADVFCERFGGKPVSIKP